MADNTEIGTVAYLIPKLGRLFAFVLAGAVGMTPALSESLGLQIAEVTVAIVLAVGSWYLSVKHDKKLEEKEPTKK